MRFLEANYQGNEILTARKGALGLIALNRPRVLNSLSHEMVVDFGKALNAFETDPQVAAVLVTGEGERGLCAGGDIRMFYESGKAGDGKASAFLRAEYRLNARIARSAKPYIVVMDGITMGGGVGVSSHGSHRIVTETTKLAMPETGIGFFPDIGASWLLSRAPGELGTWMGLTGEAINGADAISAGFADWFVPHDRIAELLGKLAKLPLPALGQTIASTIRDFTVDGPTGPFCEGRQLIDRCFSFDTVEEIVAALERDLLLHRCRLILSASSSNLVFLLRLRFAFFCGCVLRSSSAAAFCHYLGAFIFIRFLSSALVLILVIKSFCRRS